MTTNVAIYNGTNVADMTTNVAIHNAANVANHNECRNYNATNVAVDYECRRGRRMRALSSSYVPFFGIS